MRIIALALYLSYSTLNLRAETLRDRTMPMSGVMRMRIELGAPMQPTAAALARQDDIRLD